MGTTLRAKRPCSIAAAARCWLRAANASTSSRVNPSIVAIRSADTPWGTCGNLARTAGLPAEKSIGPSSAGQRDIMSTPPASTSP